MFNVSNRTTKGTQQLERVLDSNGAYADNETDSVRVILLLALCSSSLKENLHDVHKLMELSYPEGSRLLSVVSSP